MRLFWYDSFNFGDMLAHYLLAKFAGVEMGDVTFEPHDSSQHKYVLTGSILSCPGFRNATIFGAGFVFGENYFTGSHVVVAGVRGNMTLDKIRAQQTEHGNTDIKILDNVVVGEPSLCLPAFYDPVPEKRVTLGIIPHLFDYHRAVEMYGYEKGVRVIDLRRHHDEDTTKCVERVCYQIAECERTISSSLHGLIVSAAYNVPTDWCKFADNSIIGDSFKYFDFIESVTGSIHEGNGYIAPINLVGDKVSVRDILSAHRRIRNEKVDVSTILKSDFLKQIPTP